MPDQIVQAYQRNVVAADATYGGKTITVTGVVARIRRDHGGPYVELLTTGFLERNLKCYFDEANASNAAGLIKGLLVGLRGVVPRAAASTPDLEHCAVVWGSGSPKGIKAQFTICLANGNRYIPAGMTA